SSPAQIRPSPGAPGRRPAPLSPLLRTTQPLPLTRSLPVAAAAAAAAALARSLLLSPSPRRRGAVLRAQLCVYRLMPIGSPR
ncbi:Os03g0152800, partial [Oryza sativa Japonica Group]